MSKRGIQQVGPGRLEAVIALKAEKHALLIVDLPIGAVGFEPFLVSIQAVGIEGSHAGCVDSESAAARNGSAGKITATKLIAAGILQLDPDHCNGYRALCAVVNGECLLIQRRLGRADVSQNVGLQLRRWDVHDIR